MWTLILYLLTFIFNGLLAYEMTKPALIGDLPVFVLAWFLLSVLTNSLTRLVTGVNMVLTGIGTWNKYMVVVKNDWPGLSALYAVLYSLTGIGLWKLIDPHSVWEAISFVIIWKIVPAILLLFCTKTVVRST